MWAQPTSLQGSRGEFKVKVWSCLNEKTKQSIDNLERALSRLEEASNTPVTAQNSLLIDGTIQRFEFRIESFWQMLRRALLDSGIESETPREAIQTAYNPVTSSHSIVSDSSSITRLLSI